MDRLHVEQIIQGLLIELGEDPSQGRLVATPRRVADLLQMFSIQELEPILVRSASESPGRGRMIVRKFDFTSLCEHHLLPFFGRIHMSGNAMRPFAHASSRGLRIARNFRSASPSRLPTHSWRLSNQKGSELPRKAATCA